MSAKQYVFNIIQPAEHNGSRASRLFEIGIIALIIISVISVFATTFPISERVSDALYLLETVTVIIFSIEYLLRIWTADLLYPSLSGFRARFRYMRSGMALIDFFAIIPFYLPLLIPVNLLGVRAIRLVRLLRVLKLNRYSEAMNAIGSVLKQKSHEIGASLFFIGILMIISSLLIYYAEHDAQPEKFQNAFSGLWWAVATLTTVGYGDIYPVTIIGKILGAFIAISGIGMVAIPTGILSAGFIQHLEGKNSTAKYCPHCGKEI